MLSPSDELNVALNKNELRLSELGKQQLLTYIELLKTWNKVFNLTSITDTRSIIYLHIIDSLLVAPFIESSTCADVGSGAGLPGIPLAIFNPEKSWTLLDKNNKKTRFMMQAIAELQLSNVKVVHSRSEDFHPEECFASMVSRAYATLSLFVESTEHLVCADGKFIAMKGVYPQDEIDKLPKRFVVETVQRLALKGMDVERHIVCVRKVRT